MRNLLLSIFMLGFVALNAQFINNLTVSGKIVNPASKMVYLKVLGADAMVPVDSAEISPNGSFLMNLNISTANYYQLTNGGQQYTILILEPNEKVEVEVDANLMIRPIKITGSPNTEQVYKMIGELGAFDTQLKKIESDFQQVQGTAQQDSMAKILVSRYEEIEAQKMSYLKSEITNKPSLASLLFIEKIDIASEIQLYENLDKAVYPRYKDISFVNDLHQKVEKTLRLAPGRPAPEINLMTPDGGFVRLSSLKGKVVLIDFWASWCSPCRRENPNNVKMYERFKDKGFEIYAVSLDKQKSDWVKAIEDDGLKWIHVSDLRYWNSVAAKEYGVGSIPFTVLIDKNGNIIEVGLRGANLEQKLEELLGK